MPVTRGVRRQRPPGDAVGRDRRDRVSQHREPFTALQRRFDLAIQIRAINDRERRARCVMRALAAGRPRRAGIGIRDRPTTSAICRRDTAPAAAASPARRGRRRSSIRARPRSRRRRAPARRGAEFLAHIVGPRRADAPVAVRRRRGDAAAECREQRARDRMRGRPQCDRVLAAGDRGERTRRLRHAPASAARARKTPPGARRCPAARRRSCGRPRDCSRARSADGWRGGPWPRRCGRPPRHRRHRRRGRRRSRSEMRPVRPRSAAGGAFDLVGPGQHPR